MVQWLLFMQCRQAKTSYTGKLTVEVCIQYDGGAPIREKIHFGKFPIMLKVSCLAYMSSLSFCLLLDT